MAFFNLGSSIKGKLSLRFGTLVSIFTICVAFTYFTLDRSIYIYDEINEVYTPSVKKVVEMKLLISNSKALIGNWIFIQSDGKNYEKVRLNRLMELDYPHAKFELQKISANWTSEDKAALDSIFSKIDVLFVEYGSVKNVLSSFESYNDPMLVFEVTPKMQEQGSITKAFNAIIKELDEMVTNQTSHSEKASDEMKTLLKRFKMFILFMALFTITLGIFITFNTVKTLTMPINEVKNVLVKLGKGVVAGHKLKEGSDEIGEMSSALNYLTEGLKTTASYADKIGNGDFNATFKPLSEEDVLGNSLIEMGQKLKALSEEDKKRNWISTGLTKFVDILRANTDVVKLSDEVISNLVKYLGANQGGIFLLKIENGQNTLELTACYAYERKKFLTKSIQEGEGLLGQCLLEKDIIYLTEVPADYVQITSGMGSANPNCIVIQPLIVNEEMVGAIEIASFKVLDKFEIDFLQKLSENIAGVFSSVKVNARTIQLLEEAKLVQEAMRSQEEELRQNLEELTATQEEMFRKEQGYLRQLAARELSIA